jgi:MFS family permease
MSNYKKALLWLLGALFFLYEFFLRVFPNSLHENITDSFHTTAFSFALLGSAFYIFYSMMQIPVGIIINKYGIRTSLFFASLICTIGAMLFISTSNMYVAILSRCLMGIGASFGFLGLLTISIEWFPRKYIGLLSGSTQILGALGPILAGAPLVYIVSYTNSWRSVLFATGVFGIFLTLFILFFMKNKEDTSDNKPKSDIKHSIKQCCLNKNLNLTYIYAFFVYCSIPTLGAIWGVTFLEEKGLTLMESTAAISFLWLGLGIGSPAFGIFYDKFKHKVNVLSLVSFIGVLSTLYILVFDISSLSACITMFIIGCSAAGQTLSFSAISGYKDVHSLSVAFGINNTVVMISGFIVPVLIGFLVNTMDVDIKGAFVVLPIAFLVAMILGFVLRKEAVDTVL